MGRLIYLLFSMFWLFSQSTQAFDLRLTKNTSHVALINATVHTQANKELKNATIIILNGKIESVGTKVKIPKSAEIIDLEGKHVYAGFIDLYTEYGLKKAAPNTANWQDGPVYENKRSGANAWNGAIHSEISWVTEFSPSASQAKDFITQGFTTVQSAQQNGIFRGTAFVANLNSGLSNDVLVRSAAMPQLSFSRGNSAQWYPHSLMGSIALLRQTFLDATWYDDAQKAYQRNPKQEKPEYNVALEALRGYRSDFFLFDANGLLNEFRADAVMDEFKVKGMILGSGLEYRRLAEVKAMKRPLLLSPDFPEAPNVTGISAADEVSLETLKHWEMAPSNLAKLSQANVEFALSLHELKNKSDFWKNLRLAIKNGLSEAAALKALTETPAQLLGLSKELGTIAKGKFANLVISDKSIFDEKAKILTVYTAGEKNIVQAELKHDYRGYYSSMLFGDTLKLHVTGDKESPSVELKILGKSYKAKAISALDERITFSAQMDTLADFAFSFDLLKSNTALRGYYASSAQAATQIDFVQDSAFVEKPKKVEKKDDDKKILSELTYPNKAFGFKTLPKAETVLFKNATVWTSESAGILNESDVLIRNGKIAKVGKSIAAPKGAIVVDATGKHLTAGIIDEHSHIAVQGGVNELSQSITAEVRIGDVINPEDINIYRQLSGGVTASQLLHGSGNPIGGQAQVIKLRWGHSADEIKFKEAPASIKFALGENVKHSNFGDRYTERYPQTRMGVKTLMEDGFNASVAYDAAWKKYNNASSSERKTMVPPRKDLELDALSDIRNSKMFVHSHSYVASEILMLMRVAEKYGFRIQTFTHILEGYKVANEMKKHGAMASTFGDWWAYKFEVYDAIPYNSTLMHDRGVVTSINSDDAEMARRLNQEAAKAVMYGGMSEIDAWNMVTINPAKQLKVEKYTGSIKEGKHADLVLWNANPLSVYARVEQTWVDGKKYFDIERDKQLREELHQEKQRIMNKILNSGVNMKARNTQMESKMYHCIDEDTWYESAYNGEAY